MSRTVKNFLSVLAVVFFSVTASAQNSQETLNQLQAALRTTILNLKNPSLSNLQRLQTIQAQKKWAEEVMSQQITKGNANPNDLNNPGSDTALSFMYMDQLTALAQLKLEMNSDFLTEESCIEARGLVSAMNIMANSEEPQTLDLSAQNLLNLINQMCNRL